ncbi:MAG TPA: UPF0175 family protein [Candidatus Dormibacteraeota bacterium]|nr:UPF0175 family protein [Candidatus Dormibacteraeota bacterium]
MKNRTIDHLAAERDLPRAALERLALEGYQTGKLSSGQMRRMLGFPTRMQVHALLKKHGIVLHYGPDDLEHDRQAGDALLQKDALRKRTPGTDQEKA